MRTPSPVRLDRARRTLERCEAPAARDSEPAPPAASVDGGGVRLGCGLHEWLGDDADGIEAAPLAVLIELARRHAAGGRCAAWIGRRCWPHPHALVVRGAEGEGDGLLRRSVFVEAASRSELVWAAEAALRRSAVAVVDGAGLAMAESRRLQLAAKETGGVALAARPRRDAGRISAARTRWLVTPAAPSELEESRGQTWMVELLRCKGVRPEIGGARRWVARRDHGTGSIIRWRACDERVAPVVDDGRSPAAGAARRLA